MKYLRSICLISAIFFVILPPTIPLNASEAVGQIYGQPHLNIPKVMNDFISTDLFFLQDGKFEFSCSALFQKLLLGQSSVWPPPELIPLDLFNAYTLNGVIGAALMYFADDAVEAYSWDGNNVVDGYRALPHRCGPYNSTCCEESVAKYHEAVDGNVGLVLGSIAPWAEAQLLNYGAAKLITVEYSQIISSHPNITTITPVELARSFLAGNFSQVDFIFSFSSIEHDGLGRYGDPLNPFGDLETLSRLHCLLKPGGIMFFGVPTGGDCLIWNAGRFYGKYRLSLLFQHWWNVIDFFHRNNSEISLIRDESTDTVSYEEAMWVIQKATLSS